MKIGIFDSGLGGLFLMRALIEELPDYDYIYLGDTKNLPYGDRDRDSVYELTKNAVDYLFRNDCKLVILACNTASAMALRKLQQEYLPINYPDRKILGVLVPMAESVAERRPTRVGVLGTRGTVNSNSFVEEINKIDPDIEVLQNAAPLLVPLIENGEFEKIDPVLHEYLLPIRDVDSLVLGCTHYSIIKGLIGKFLDEDINIICQTDVVPEKLRDYLKRHEDIDMSLSKKSERAFFVTNLTDHFLKLADEWFEGDVDLNLVSIERP